MSTGRVGAGNIIDHVLHPRHPHTSAELQRLDEDERAIMKGTDRTRVEEAARLEGITFEQAMERRKGYRYLY